MPVTRVFRGRTVVHTRKVGDRIELTYAAAARGFERERETVPFSDYAREVRKDFRPAAPARAAR